MAGHSSMARPEKKAENKAEKNTAKLIAETSPGNPGNNPKNYVASVGKAFAVLRSFSSEAFELTLSEVAARADLDRGTAFRLIQTLVALGYLQAVPQSRRFRLGVACLDLGYTVLSHGSLRPIVEPLLRRLVPAVGDAASLGVLDGGDVVYPARIAGSLLRHKSGRLTRTRLPLVSARLATASLELLPLVRH